MSVTQEIFKSILSLHCFSYEIFISFYNEKSFPLITLLFHIGCYVEMLMDVTLILKFKNYLSHALADGFSCALFLLVSSVVFCLLPGFLYQYIIWTTNNTFTMFLHISDSSIKTKAAYFRQRQSWGKRTKWNVFIAIHSYHCIGTEWNVFVAIHSDHTTLETAINISIWMKTSFWWCTAIIE